jgi:uncharacterized protein YabN with tetrapyrrole methylase and pyrophosphatase domain
VPNNLPLALPPRAAVYICGIGLRVPHDLTLETIACISASNKVFGLPAGVIPNLWPGADVVDLSVLYSEDVSRDLTYREMAAQVIESAIHDPPVAFVTYGSPSVGTDPVRYIRSLSSQHGLSTHEALAPSSLEALCSLIGLDPFNGLQIIEATRLVQQPGLLSTKLWTFLMQVPYTGQLTATHDVTVGMRFDAVAIQALTRLISRAYSPEHECLFVRAPIHDYNLAASITRADAIAENTPTNSATLVIPPRGQALRRHKGES